jgi:tripartite-type tricarboxylate transporter receptor subunit TctC
MVFARAFAAVLLAACLMATGASAQTYPNRPITLIVPFPPGGATDAIARIIQSPSSWKMSAAPAA